MCLYRKDYDSNVKVNISCVVSLVTIIDIFSNRYFLLSLIFSVVFPCDIKAYYSHDCLSFLVSIP